MRIKRYMLGGLAELSFRAKMCLMVPMVLLLTVPVVAYLSDRMGQSISATAGYIEVQIDNQRIETTDVGNVTADELLANPSYANTKTVNNWTTADVNTFSYTIESTGTNAIEASSTWYLAWDAPESDNSWKYQEAYYIYVYPADMSDDAIMNDIMNNWGNAATVRVCNPYVAGECDGGWPTTDEYFYLPNEAQTAENYRHGLKFQMPNSAILNGSAEVVPQANGQTSQTYTYKVVFGSSYDTNKLDPAWFTDLFSGLDFRFDVVVDAKGVNTQNWTDSDATDYLLTNAQIDPNASIFPPDGQVTYTLNSSGNLVATINVNKPVSASNGYSCVPSSTPPNTTYVCTKTYSQKVADETVTLTAINDGVGMSSDVVVYASPFITTWSTHGQPNNASIFWRDERFCGLGRWLDRKLRGYIGTANSLVFFGWPIYRYGIWRDTKYRPLQQ